MQTIKKILLPTDFSPNALHAIHYALNLFDTVYCEFTILNSYSIADNKLKSHINKRLYPKQYAALKQKSENGLEDLLGNLVSKNNPYHNFKKVSVEGNALEAIQNYVNDENIDMIIMGSQGVTRSRKVAYGTVAIYVMEKIRNCPSIIVPKTASIEKPGEIVYPTSYDDPIYPDELKHLITVAKLSNARIAILHVSKEEELTPGQLRSQQDLREIVKDLHHSFHWLSHDSVADAVRLFCESRASDMVAFINRKHLFFDNVLIQPMVKGLSFYSKAPILVLHDT